METGFLTTGDLALMESNKHDYHRRGNGMAATGLGLACGLGGGALLLAIAGIWGVNAASKARSEGNTNALNLVAQTLAGEKSANEAWKVNNAPTIKNYVDAQSSSGAGSVSSALALALAQNNSLGNAIGTDSFLKVARYSAPQPCGCGCGE